MAHKHGHTHGHTHGEPAGHETPEIGRVDAAERSLSEALRISFVILKVIMIVLVVAFVVSGFKTVESNEQALRLVFGEITGTGDKRILTSDWHWVFPYPVGEIVKIPVEKQIKLTVDSFWYFETRSDVLGDGPKPRRLTRPELNPLTEGYSLTRSEKRQTDGVTGGGGTGRAQPAGASDADGSDYNIVHSKWEIDYQIDNIERFFRNVHVRDVAPGEIYEDVMIESVTPLLRSAIENAVVTAMVRYSIDEALQSQDTIRRHVQQLVQEQLNVVESGIRVSSVQLVDVEWPKQVNDAFEAYFTASQISQQAVSEARKAAETTLTDAGGQVAESLYQALMAEEPDDDFLETLWSQVAGQAQDTLAQAQAYRTKVVEAAKANANYLLSILPEWRKRPELVTQRIYLGTIERVLQNAEEKIILPPADKRKGREVRVLVNRDPLNVRTEQSEERSN
ncbi:MAG: SPFH domain-containing protein [Planctomycetota bacterium]|jgi:regulator of protease activity HflC (stomatin/prohibitin superfamily)